MKKYLLTAAFLLVISPAYAFLASPNGNFNVTTISPSGTSNDNFVLIPGFIDPINITITNTMSGPGVKKLNITLNSTNSIWNSSLYSLNFTISDYAKNKNIFTINGGESVNATLNFSENPATLTPGTYTNLFSSQKLIIANANSSTDYVSLNITLFIPLRFSNNVAQFGGNLNPLWSNEQYYFNVTPFMGYSGLRLNLSADVNASLFDNNTLRKTTNMSLYPSALFPMPNATVAYFLINGSINSTFSATLEPSTLLLGSLDSITNKSSSLVGGTALYVNLSSIAYQNSTAVNSSLLTYAVTAQHKNSSLLSRGSVTLTSVNITNNSANHSFDLSLPSDMLGGDWVLKVLVSDSLNSGTYTKDFTVQDSALKLSVSCNKATLDLANTSDQSICTGNIANYGNATVNWVNITITQSGGPCVQFPNGNATSTTNFTSVAPQIGLVATWTLKPLSTVACTLNFAAAASGTQWDTATTVSIPFTVVNNTPSNSSTSSNTNTNTNSDSGGGSSTTQTQVKQLTISDYPSSLELKQGTTTKLSFKVKNTGSVDVRDVTASIGGFSGWKSLTDPDVIIKGTSKSYDIEFSASATEPIGEKEITITAKGTYSGSDVSSSVKIKLKITPSDATIALLQSNYTAYLSLYNDLLNRVNGNLFGIGNTSNSTINLTAALNDALSFLNSANQSFASKDYLAAAASLSKAYEKLSLVRAQVGGGFALPDISGLFTLVSADPIPAATGAVAIAVIFLAKFKGAAIKLPSSSSGFKYKYNKRKFDKVLRFLKRALSAD